jgi:GNAT superfamily N-acetyltransferase
MTTMSIEPASAADYPLFQRLFEELQTGDPPTPQSEFERHIAPNMLVARASDGEALGYVFAEVFGTACYVRHIVTSPHARKKGVGRALISAAAERAAGRGAGHLELNVKLGNHAAIALYERIGMRAVYESVVLRMPWGLIPEPGDRKSHIVTVDKALAGAVEARFELPEGLIAGHVASLQHVVLAARRDEGISGVASFRPIFPGVFPLRASSADEALQLLAALRSHAVEISDAERPWRSGGVQLAIEDSPDAGALLVRAGGDEVFRIAHMKGPISAALTDKQCPTPDART